MNFLGDYFGDMRDDWLVNLCAIRDGKIVGLYRSVAEIKSDAGHVSRFVDHWQADERNIYFTCNPLAKKGDKHASENDLAEIWFVPLDCDPPADLSPEDREQWKADKIIELEATDAMSIVDSGNGVQAIFRLTEPVTKDKAKEIAETLIAKHGGDKAPKSPANLMRLPGTINYPNANKIKKGCVEVEAKVIRLDLGRRLSVEDSPAAVVTPIREPSKAVTVADLSENRAAKLIASGSSMIARRLDFESVIAPAITALFWQEQDERPGETQAEGVTELKGILKNLRKKVTGDGGGFADLVRHVPAIETSRSVVMYSFTYDGSPVRVDGSKRLRNYASIIEAVIDQAGKFPDITARTWPGILRELGETMKSLPYTESEEDAVVYALVNRIHESFQSTSQGVAYHSLRLSLPTAEAWLDLKKGRIYFKGPPMLSHLNATGLGFKITSHQFAEIVRACDGEAAKQTRVTIDDKGGKRFSRSMRLWWIPCGDDELRFYREQASDKSIDRYDKSVVFKGETVELSARRTGVRDADPTKEIAHAVALENMKLERPY